MELRDYIDYIKYERKLSLETIKNYKYDLEKFLVFLEKKNISDFSLVNSSLIEEYLITLSNYSSKTVSRNITFINIFFIFFIFLIREKKISSNPCGSIDRPKLDKKLPDTLSIEEVNSLLDIVLKTPFDYRNKAILEILYGCGLRIGEVINLTTRDVDFENSVI